MTPAGDGRRRLGVGRVGADSDVGVACPGGLQVLRQPRLRARADRLSPDARLRRFFPGARRTRGPSRRGGRPDGCFLFNRWVWFARLAAAQACGARPVRAACRVCAAGRMRRRGRAGSTTSRATAAVLSWDVCFLRCGMGRNEADS